MHARGSRPVRAATGLSAVAAAIMVFGVILLGIDKEQGFLTWFAVTFGSLTVSVGVTSFALVRDREGDSDDSLD